jgi:hypothetical protein
LGGSYHYCACRGSEIALHLPPRTSNCDTLSRVCTAITARGKSCISRHTTGCAPNRSR